MGSIPTKTASLTNGIGRTGRRQSTRHEVAAGRVGGLALLMRMAQAALLGLLAIGSMGAADTSVRYNDLGHKMMCVCSCAQILIECNHVGCPDSDSMLRMLRTSLANGDSDDTILRAFQAKYGPTALAAPMLTRFNAVAWIVPPAVLALGLLGAVVLIRRWKQVHHQRVPISAYSPQAIATRDRVRDQVRRETEL